jgi:hypothetical protein
MIDDPPDARFQLNRKPISIVTLVLLGLFDKKFSKPGVTIGAWHGGDRKPNGHINFPFFAFSVETNELFKFVYARGLVNSDFDWVNWHKGERAQTLFASCRDDGFKAIRDITDVDDIVRMITAIFRADKYCEGTVAGEFEDGRLQAIFRRAMELALDWHDQGKTHG